MSAAHSQFRRLQLHLPRLRLPAIPSTKRPRLLGELIVGALLFGTYLLVDSFVGAARTASARSHAERVIQLEQWLHIDIEPQLNAWLSGHPALRTAANTSTRPPM